MVLLDNLEILSFRFLADRYSTSSSSIKIIGEKSINEKVVS
ncbi:hypothetical protein [Nostoc punctiforme]|nr:hypothetical protein [Nostoc punctiforme]